MRYYIVILLITATAQLKGQKFYENYKPHLYYDTVDAGKLSVHFYNNNFVKNNEYFGPFTQGITYLGVIIQPEVTWSCSKNFSFTAGWYLRQFFGYDGFEKSLPVFRARYAFMPGGSFVIGQLEGQRQHGYIEPLYSEDLYFLKNPEYGEQLVIDREKFRSELFMDWEKFLMPGDNHKEEITGGLLVSYAPGGFSTNRGLSIHLQSIINHFGGQVTTLETPMQTRANLAGGLEYAFLLPLPYLKRIVLSSYYLEAREMSPTNTIQYDKGFATYNTLGFENKYVKLNAGWFHGEKYFAPMGDYLFQSISELNPSYTCNTRNLVTSKLLLNKDITKGVNFGLRFESYLDLHRHWLDFSYGMNISVNGSVFEKTLKSKTM